MGVDVVAVEDDQVLAAAGDDDLTGVEEGQVAGVQPVPSGGEGRGVGLRVVDVARGEAGGRADLEAADAAVGGEVAVVVDDAQGDTVRGRPGGDEGDGLLVRGRVVGAQEVAAEAALEQPLHGPGPVESAVGDAGDGLRHAPGRDDVPLADAVARGRVEEVAHDGQRDLLAAADEGLQTAQVPCPVGRFPLQRVRDQPIREGRRPAVPRPVLVHQVQPAQRVGQHPLGRRVDVGAAGEDGEQVVEQERPTVVDREPVDHGVVGADVQDPAAARGEVGEPFVCEPGGLGRAGAAGGEHQQGDVGAVGFGVLVRGRGVRELVHLREDERVVQ